jgi:hypothetical protein
VLGAILDLACHQWGADEGTGQRRQDNQAVLEDVEPHDALGDPAEEIIRQAITGSAGSSTTS